MAVRILHVVDSWALGGLQNGVANLIQRMDSTYFENVICAMRPVTAENVQRLPVGAQLTGLSGKGARRRVQIPALADKIREVKPDIVHTRNWGTFEAQLAALGVGKCGRVHSEHGIDWDTTEKEPWRRILCRRAAFESANRVLSVSSQLREVHARRTGFAGHKIEVIHNGVDTSRFKPDRDTRERVRRELGISPDEFTIGCVGNLIPVKDHVTLLNGIVGFARAGCPWRLLIAGAGPELPRLMAIAEAHPEWKERVHFLGRSDAVPDLLNAMDAYVLSSLTEGISNSLLEAMATGLAVVATATGGNPEIVEDGDCGLLFPVGDSACLEENLRTLEARPARRAELGRKATARVHAEFSLRSMVKKYEELYQSLAPASFAAGRVLTRV